MPSSPVKYSKLNQSEENASQSKHALLEDPNSGYMSELEGPPLPANTLSKICGFFSCLLLLTCAVLAIAIAKVLESNKFLKSDYTNYTSSYSFGVLAGLSIDIHDEPCCKFDTQYGCVCCPTTPALLETTFSSFITVLEMYVNTKFILYLGDIAKDPADTADTYQFFSDYVEKLHIKIPVFPTLGRRDQPKVIENSTQYYLDIYKSWGKMINCFGCSLQPRQPRVRETFLTGGYYEVLDSSGIRIISVNTNLFLKEAPYDTYDKAVDQLAWLKEILQKSADNYEPKILIGGTPPGLSSQDILASPKVGEVALQWREEFQTQFIELLFKFRYRFSAITMGYGQYDLLRKLKYDFAFLSPPCSPYLCTNPAFRVAFLSERDLRLLDFHQYYTPIDFFTRSNKTPRYIFDHSIERIVFGNEVSGPAYLNSYSLSMLLDTILRPADNMWQALVSTLNAHGGAKHTSPYIAQCTSEYTQRSQIEECLKKYKFLGNEGSAKTED